MPQRKRLPNYSPFGSYQVVWLLIASALFALGADDSPKPMDAKAELAKLQPYIGQWRGVGQLRRGSTQGAWTENSQWIWKFGERGPAFAFESSEAKYLSGGALRVIGRDDYELTAVRPDGSEQVFRGAIDEDRLVLTSDQPSDDQPDRITIRQVAGGDRMLILYERRTPGTDRFSRLAEVGYTRVGSDFGKGSTMIECIVTGGKGTMPVTYNGKTYYVCCTGCRDLFNEDPEGVLTEYRAKKEAERAKP